MKRKATAILLVLTLLASLLMGCSDSGGVKKPSGNGADKGYAGREISILLHRGGGGDYYAPVVESLRKAYPELTVNYEYADEGAERMKQLVLSGETPDIFSLNQGMYNYYAAIQEGICGPINDYLELSTLDGSAKLGDVVDTGLMVKGRVDDKYYIWPEIIFTSGLWYDGNLFETNSIKVPETWAEFEAAGDKLDALGIDLLGYCGMMAHEYPLDYMFYPFLISLDEEAFTKVQNLADDAWDTPAMVELVNRLQSLRDKDYTSKAAIALGNNETQMEFINHKFAFLPCGSWLEAEMGDAWTSDWKLNFLPYSGRTDTGGSNYVHMISLISAVSADSENTDLIGEFYRYLYSDPETIKAVVGVAQNGLPIKDFGANYGDLLNDSTAQVWKAIDDGSKTFVSLTTNWYAQSSKDFADAFNSFMNGQSSGDEFRARMKAAMKAIKDSSEYEKYTYSLN